MKIASAAVALQSQHFSAVYQYRQESLRAWVGQVRPDFEGNVAHRQAAPVPPPAVQISAAGKSAQSAEANAIGNATDAAENDPFIQLLKAVLEWMMGKPVSLFHASSLQSGTSPPPAQENQARQDPDPSAPTPQRAGFGIEYDYHATREEVERTSFSAQGVVTTVDGREVAFKLDLSMSRSYVEQTDISARAGDALRSDPLVINFGGTAAQLANQRFRFDINGDGEAVDVPLLTGNSGYLALDVNGNGKIDSGTELFGPASGSGFAELARYDEDGNGWIDESDPVFGRLQTWTPDAEGAGTLSTLAEHDVGALYLGNVDTAFELRGGNNQDLGAVRDSGIYLTEAGQAGSIQEIDLTI